jgi:DHA1 family tetracycline resistance protein-like MFS transporter
MRRRPALPFLYATILLDLLGLGLVVPIAPQLVASLGGSRQAGAAYYGMLVASYGLLQFLAAPLLGSLSDRYGRRPVLIASIAALALDYLAFAVTPSLWLLFVSRALAGAVSGTYIVVNASIVDITAPEERARAFGMVGAMFGVGFVAGPLLGGLLGSVNMRLPFIVAASLAAANVCYGLFVLPESLPRERRRRVSARLANPFTAIVALASRPGAGRLVWSRLFSEVARQVHQVVWILYAGYAFGWGPGRVGVAMAFGGLVGAAVQAWLTDRITRRLGLKATVVVGTSVIGGVFLLTGLTPDSWTLWPLLAMGSLAGVVAAAAQSWVSRTAGESEQGAVQGAWGAISSFTEMAVPIPAAALFAWSITAARPGLAFVVAAGCLGLAAWLASRAAVPAGTSPVVEPVGTPVADPVG